jgi:hypothetical protein
VKNPRIVGALLVGIALVVCAFYVRDAATQTAQDATIAVADTPRKYIATKDSDEDGMRDWEEELYGTNPKRADKLARATLTSSSTSNSADAFDLLPDTMTKNFAVSFFSDYIGRAVSGEEMDEATTEAFIADATAYAAQESADRPFTTADVTVGVSNDAEAVRVYGNRIADALTKYTVSGDSEMVILERALQSDNEADLEPLKAIVASYNKSLSDVLMTPVPPAFVDEHVALLNALLALHNNIAAMQGAFTDALPAMVRFQRHPSDIASLSSALASMSIRFEQFGATYTTEEPGYLWGLLK